MWTQATFFLAIFAFAFSEITVAGIDRTVPEGVKSMGFNIVYGDEDMTVINHVVNDLEKQEVMKSRVNLDEALPPLPAQDVKCLMSIDRYCSKEMGQIKNTLIQALKDDCQSCSDKEREDAGKVAASMMAHDSYAWKMFLTRFVLQTKMPKRSRATRDLQLKSFGDPEDIVSSKSRYLKPGFEVRVKRYNAKIVP